MSYGFDSGYNQPPGCFGDGFRGVECDSCGEMLDDSDRCPNPDCINHVPTDEELMGG